MTLVFVGVVCCVMRFLGDGKKENEKESSENLLFYRNTAPIHKLAIPLYPYGFCGVICPLPMVCVCRDFRGELSQMVERGSGLNTHILHQFLFLYVGSTIGTSDAFTLYTPLLQTTRIVVVVARRFVPFPLQLEWFHANRTIGKRPQFFVFH